MRSSSKLGVGGFVLAACLAVGVAAFSPRASSAQERPRVAEIHEAIAAAGLPVESVRCNTVDGKLVYDVVLRAGCTPDQHAEACRIRDEVLARAPAGPTRVATVEDALVVLRFEPQNAEALRLVQQRYDQLRARTRGAEGASPRRAPDRPTKR